MIRLKEVIDSGIWLFKLAWCCLISIGVILSAIISISVAYKVGILDADSFSYLGNIVVNCVKFMLWFFTILLILEVIEGITHKLGYTMWVCIFRKCPVCKKKIKFPNEKKERKA